MEQLVLVLNCGSSSVKFAILNPKTQFTHISGLVQAIGTPEANLKYTLNNETVRTELPNVDHHEALQQVITIIKSNPNIANQLVAIGHRIVHGGEHFTASAIVTDEVIQAIRDSAILAPLHSPAHLLGIEEALKAFPELPNVTVFDTAFHQTMPEYAYLYAIPYELYEQHQIRKYGFHGTSHRFVSIKAAEILGKPLTETSLVTAHLGNGCSVTAIQNGKSIDTTMGLTPLDGLMMGTRSGEVDPNLHLHLVDNLGYDIHKVTNILNKESGVLGVSGLASDFRILEDAAEKGHKRAVLALEMFCYKLAKAISSMAVAVLGKLDALVFTGGIGENSRVVRAKTLERLKLLGFKLDEARNQANGKESRGVITADNSTVAVVVPTNEELMIAIDTLELINK